MVHILRLITLLFLSFASYAITPTTYSNRSSFTTDQGNTYYSYGSTASESRSNAVNNCSSLVSETVGTYNYTYNGTGQPVYNSSWFLSCNSSAYNKTTNALVSSSVSLQEALSTISGTYATCPSNSTLSGSSCTCNTGFIESGNSCVQKSCPAQGTNLGVNTIQVSTSFDSEFAEGSIDGCTTATRCSSIAGYDGKKYCVGQTIYTGEQSTTPPAETNSPSGGETAEKMKDGYCPGEVNGTTVYVPCTSVSQETKSSTTTGGDGSTSSTKSTTSCEGGKCTTTETTTTTDANGQTTSKETSTTQEQTDFCQNNPGHSSCKSGSFGGSCDGGFKCEGDPIQCAMAKVQHENKCALTPAANAGAAYFDALTEGMPNNPNNGTVTVGSSMFNTSNLLGSSSCTLDKSITVWGSTINLPFSQVCTALAYMGTLLQAVGFLLGARIITRG